MAVPGCQAFGGSGSCKDVAKQVNDHCADKVQRKGDRVNRKKSLEAMCKPAPPEENKCRDALKCVLTPKNPNNCCPDKNGTKPTPHHIVPASQFHDANGNPLAFQSGGRYSYNKAPCVCAEGNSHSVGKHGEIHGETNTRTRAFLGVEAGRQIPDQRWPVAAAERIGAEAVATSTGCPKECIQEQVRRGHARMGIAPNDRIRPTYAGGEAASGPPILLDLRIRLENQNE